MHDGFYDRAGAVRLAVPDQQELLNIMCFWLLITKVEMAQTPDEPVTMDAMMILISMMLINEQTCACTIYLRLRYVCMCTTFHCCRRMIVLTFR